MRMLVMRVFHGVFSVVTCVNCEQMLYFTLTGFALDCESIRPLPGNTNRNTGARRASF